MTVVREIRGLDQLDANLAAIVSKAVDPQSGIVNALDEGSRREIVPEVRKNIYANFNVITGEFPAGVITRKINQYRVDVLVNRVYAAVQEYGGTFNITPRQRAFFWAKWYETGDTMWKALALSSSYTIPARPYFRPAIDAKSEAAARVAADRLYDIIDSAVK
jgi:phage gpG-like protein